MKYDLELSLEDSNTSHAQVAELVGTGQRVLDVGCSTGYLARVLKARGNRVSGVEIDEEAAKSAEPDLERLVVGDLETMALLDHFEEGSFDVVIFADVLEHLRDPVTVLKGAVPLLAPGGSVVISLPNVAHGAVRLALLEGRFEYRPLGLLDDTHLRFFTRSSMEEMLQAAGLVVLEMRRTVADPFGTEIPLSPERYPPDVVDRVRSSPDHDTYQFVFKAVPAGAGPGWDFGAELVARNEELQSLRASVTRILAAAVHVPLAHTAGLVVPAGGDRWASLRASVTAAELRRRLDGMALALLATEADPAPATWRGEPVLPFPAGDPAAVELAADAYDAVVFTGEAPAGLIGELGERGCPVLPFAVLPDHLDRFPGPSSPLVVRSAPGSAPGRAALAVPDPLLLADRLVGADSLPLRLEYLRAAGRLSGPSPYVLRDAAGGVADSAGGVDDVVVLPDDATEIDILALVHGARLVVTGSAPLAAVALALGRPVAPSGSSPELAALAAWCGAPLPPTRDDGTDPSGWQRPSLAVDALEAAYDEVAGAVRGAAARRLSLHIEEVLRLHSSRIEALQAANAALQGRLVGERTALGGTAARLLAAEQARREAEVTISRLQLELDASRRAAEEARHELDALLATKTMTLLQPARRVYGRVRGVGR